MYDDNNIASWGAIDQNTSDIDAMTRLYVYDTVTKYIDMADTDNEPIPSTFSDWRDILGEELAWDYKQGSLSDAIFERFCGRCDALLPYFLERYPRTVNIDWNN